MAGAAAAALPAALSVLGGVGQAISKQSHSPVSGTPARVDTSTAAIAAARTDKLARRLSRNAREERLMALLTDPQVMGLLTTIGGLMLATHLPFSENPTTNARLQGLAASCAVLMGLGRAGVGDLTTLAVAGGAGAAVAYGGGGADALFPNIPGTDVPAWALTGPGSIVWALREINERV